MPSHNSSLDTGVTLNTTDATPTVAATFATKPNTSYLVTAKVIATETADHDETGAYVRIAAFKNDGGTLAIVGSEDTTFTAETTGGHDVALTASGTDIICTVTGAAATLLTWRVDLEILEVS